MNIPHSKHYNQKRNRKYSLTGLIIAAGLSSRMDSFKPLLSYEGKTFLRNIIDKLFPFCDEIIVVTGNKSELIIDSLNEVPNHVQENIKVFRNDIYESGMFTSLKKGVENSNGDWLLYHFIDQPNLPNEFYKMFINEIDISYDWIQPVKDCRKGHPIMINTNVKEIISESGINSNLRELSNNKKLLKKYWECEFEEIFTDIDTIEDFNKIKGK